MSRDLLATRLARDGNCRASAVPPTDLLRELEADHAHLVVIGAEINQKSGSGFDLAQAVNRAHPGVLICCPFKSPVTSVRCLRISQRSARNILSTAAGGRAARLRRTCTQGLNLGGCAESDFFSWTALKCIPAPNITMTDESSALFELEVVRCTAGWGRPTRLLQQNWHHEHTSEKLPFPIV